MYDLSSRNNAVGYHHRAAENPSRPQHLRPGAGVGGLPVSLSTNTPNPQGHMDFGGLGVTPSGSAAFGSLSKPPTSGLPHSAQRAVSDEHSAWHATPRFGQSELTASASFQPWRSTQPPPPGPRTPSTADAHLADPYRFATYSQSGAPISAQMRASVDQKLRGGAGERGGQAFASHNSHLSGSTNDDEVLAALQRDPKTAHHAQERTKEIIQELLSADTASRSNPMPPSSSKASPAYAGTPSSHVHSLEMEVVQTRREMERARQELEMTRQHDSAKVQSMQTSGAQAVIKQERLEREVSDLRRIADDRMADIAAANSALVAANQAKTEAARKAAMTETQLTHVEHAAVAKTDQLQQGMSALEKQLQERQEEVQSLRVALHDRNSDLERSQQRLKRQQQEWQERESQLTTTSVHSSGHLQKLSMELDQVKLQLAAEEQERQRLESAAADFRKHKKKFKMEASQMEALLQESEAERGELRTKYMELGEKLDGLLREEQTTKQAAEMFEQQQQETEKKLMSDVQGLSDENKALMDENRALADENAMLKQKSKEVKQKLSEEEHQRKKAQKAQKRQAEAAASEMDRLAKEADLIKAQAGETGERNLGALERCEAEFKMKEKELAQTQTQVQMLEQQLERQLLNGEELKRTLEREMQDRLETEKRQMQSTYERRVSELELELRLKAAQPQPMHIPVQNPMLPMVPMSMMPHGMDYGQQMLYQQLLDAKSDGLKRMEVSATAGEIEQRVRDAVEARLATTLKEYISKGDHYQLMSEKTEDMIKQHTAELKQLADRCQEEKAAALWQQNDASQKECQRVQDAADAEWGSRMTALEERAAQRISELELDMERTNRDVEERCAAEYNLAVTTSRSAIDAAESHLEDKDKEARSLKRQIENLQREAADLEREKKMLQSELEKSGQDCAQLASHAEEAGKHIARLKRMVEEEQTRNRHLQENLSDQARKLEHAEERHEASERGRQEAVLEHQKAMAQTKDSLQDLAQIGEEKVVAARRATELEHELARRQQEMLSVQRDLETLRTTMAGAEATWKAKEESWKMKADHLTSEIEALKERSQQDLKALRERCKADVEAATAHAQGEVEAVRQSAIQEQQRKLSQFRLQKGSP
ncbi:hypothetical protein CYMTET_49988 [Cymbomonas tetramitiformis]|uniref:Uncharacterized protein n=1 Tax=Cymbomonas tetramitiformis TaxID=36881 RepID=A0AAE0BP39_9CHLO|nr:hypothetical protein CYMTET_49988 [Cymbomonas tetramitiformis]